VRSSSGLILYVPTSLESVHSELIDSFVIQVVLSINVAAEIWL